MELYSWIGFGVFVLGMLILDLGVFHKEAHEVKIKEALTWSLVWILLAMLFNLWVYYSRGADDALKFLTGYLLEKSLSIDNLFVFLLIFRYFKVPHRFQHKILFWGIIGALVMRAVFIAFGIALIHSFHWIIYVFGVILIFTGIKLAFEKEKEINPEKNIVLKFFKKIFPVTNTYEKGKEGNFLIKKDGQLWATPLMVVLIIVETTDVIFAVDSIPAILAVTHDPFIVYTSNVFAILGLRALYFALSGLMQLFHHLHYGLALILVFVGTKMLISDFYKVPTLAALLAIVIILTASVIASLIWPEVKKEAEKLGVLPHD